MDRRQRHVQNATFEITSNDVNTIIDNSMEDAATRMEDIQARANSGGIVSGLETSVAGSNIIITTGTAYNSLMIKGFTTSLTTLIYGNSYNDGVGGTIVYNNTMGTKDVVLLIYIQDDTTSSKISPYTGNVDYTKKEAVTEIAIVDTGAYPNNLGTDYVKLCRIDSFSGTVPILNDIASHTFTFATSSLNVFPGTSTTPVRGFAGNKYYWITQTILGGSVSASEQAHPTNNGAYYLNITVPVDSGGVATVTVQDVATAINTLTNFYATTTGTPASDQFTIADMSAYSSLTGGDSYKSYYSTQINSDSINANQMFSNDFITQHVESLGRGTPSFNNPHGTTAEDLDINDQELYDHRTRGHEKRSGIAKGSNRDYGYVVYDGFSPDTLVIDGKTSSDDRAIIDGKTVTEIVNANSGNNYRYTETSSFCLLKEVFLTGDGFLQTRNAIEFSTKNIRSQGVGDGDPILTVYDKHPLLEGSFSLNMIINTSTPVDVDVSIDSGPVTNITADDTVYRVYTEKGYWIDVVYDDTLTGGYLLPTGVTKTDTITALKTERDEELSLALAFWRPFSNRFGVLTSSYILKDTRRYGTDGVFNNQNKQINNITKPSVTFSPVDTTYGTMLSDDGLYLIPFTVEYHGRKFKFDSTELDGNFGLTAGGGAATAHIIARFTDGLTSTQNYNVELKSLGSDITGFNFETDVYIGKIEYDGSKGVASTSKFAPQKSFENYVTYDLHVGTIYNSSIDAALDFAESFSDVFYSTYALEAYFNIYLHESVVMGRDHNVRNIAFFGNGYTFTSVGKTISYQRMIASNTSFVDTKFSDKATGLHSTILEDVTITASFVTLLNPEKLFETTTGSGVYFLSDVFISVTGTALTVDIFNVSAGAAISIKSSNSAYSGSTGRAFISVATATATMYSENDVFSGVLFNFSGTDSLYASNSSISFGASNDLFTFEPGASETATLDLSDCRISTASTDINSFSGSNTTTATYKARFKGCDITMSSSADPNFLIMDVDAAYNKVEINLSDNVIRFSGTNTQTHILKQTTQNGVISEGFVDINGLIVEAENTDIVRLFNNTNATTEEFYVTEGKVVARNITCVATSGTPIFYNEVRSPNVIIDNMVCHEDETGNNVLEVRGTQVDINKIINIGTISVEALADDCHVVVSNCVGERTGNFITLDIAGTSDGVMNAISNSFKTSSSSYYVARLTDSVGGGTSKGGATGNIGEGTHLSTVDNFTGADGNITI